MDRNINCNSNFTQKKQSLSARRAWIEIRRALGFVDPDASLSARRAWIEMTYVTRLPRCQVVALRKESVDRNNISTNNHIRVRQSLSARRAWIEIVRFSASLILPLSSLSARRAWIEITQCKLKLSKCTRRSPQGERG